MTTTVNDKSLLWSNAVQIFLSDFIKVMYCLYFLKYLWNYNRVRYYIIKHIRIFFFYFLLWYNEWIFGGNVPTSNSSPSYLWYSCGSKTWGATFCFLQCFYTFDFRMYDSFTNQLCDSISSFDFIISGSKIE